MFMLDSIAMILLVFMGLRDDRRASGMPHSSLFRTRDPDQQSVSVDPGRATQIGPDQGPAA